MVHDPHHSPGGSGSSRPLWVDISVHAPAVAGRVTPLLHLSISPDTHGELDRPVLRLQRVPNPVISICALGRVPVIPRGGIGIVRVLVVEVLVAPGAWNVAVVILEIC